MQPIGAKFGAKRCNDRDPLLPRNETCNKSQCNEMINKTFQNVSSAGYGSQWKDSLASYIDELAER
jgi:hypothetical protein